MGRALAASLALLGAVAVSASQVPVAPGADAAFAGFFEAGNVRDAEAASTQIVASGVGFDEAFRRLRTGRTYSREVPRGVVRASYKSETGEYFYALDVPEGYDPSRTYQVRVQLHGGVGRIEQNTPRDSAPLGRLAGAEQIYVIPYAWRDAPWWGGRQVDNLHTILDLVKRRYNVDENRVVLSGVSDGGTGAYYVATRDTTPFASVLPLNGFVMVLRNEASDADGDLFVNNLVNKPMFIVNGGKDPLYPTMVVDPYVAHLKSGGVDLVYQPQPNAGHDTSWWPEVKDSFEAFVAAHPRHPLPDTLSWSSGPPHIPSRAHWLVIDKLAAQRPDAPKLADLNVMEMPREAEFGIRSSGARVNRVVKGSNAEQMGLRSGDLIVRVNNQSTADGADVGDMLREYPAGRPLLLTVTRGSESVRVTGRYAPTVLPDETHAMFPLQRESGRVDLKRTGNTVDASTSGVGTFTLLLSPDQFDLSRAITVVVNGHTAFEGVVQKDVRTLLKWAAQDNDRTMLFAAELHIDVP